MPAPEVRRQRERQLERVRDARRAARRRRPRDVSTTRRRAAARPSPRSPRNIIPKPTTPESREVTRPGLQARQQQAEQLRRRPRGRRRAPSRRAASRRSGRRAARARSPPAAAIGSARLGHGARRRDDAVDHGRPRGSGDRRRTCREGCRRRRRRARRARRSRPPRRRRRPRRCSRAVAASSKAPAPAGWKDCRGEGSIRREHTRACAELVTRQTRLSCEKRQSLYAPARGVPRAPSRLRTTVVLVHGSVQNSVTWTRQLPLADEFALVLPDRPGYPPNPPPSRRSTSTCRPARWQSCSATARTSPGSRTAG